MELVHGETLQERLKRGAIPMDEALAIAKQVAEALEAAHDKDIIHRDLKPANVKITPEGRVKVLDFGLAKALDTGPAHADLSNSPTLMSMAATNSGMILGTAAYMSPEQAKGLAVDRRTDIFSFGAMLYEMLTGRQAFQGDNLSEILARVIEREPEWSHVPAATPAGIRRLLRRCLHKDRRRRTQTAIDILIELEEAKIEPETSVQSVTTIAPSHRFRRIFTAFFVLATIALAVPAIMHFREDSTAPPQTRLEINTPSTADPLSFAISPDGRRLVFVASGNGPSRLWLRPLDETSAQPLAGTEAASYPFWSPDSRSVGFFAGGKLKRVDIGGGLPQTLANAILGYGGTWNADGVILFSTAPSNVILRVVASGGGRL
jgi:serine/threonine protein kinase